MGIAEKDQMLDHFETAVVIVSVAVIVLVAVAVLTVVVCKNLIRGMWNG